MALKKLKFNLPNGKIINVDLEETVSISSFLNQLKVREILDANGNFKIQGKNGNSIPDNSLFGNIRDNELTVIDTDSISSPGIEQFPDIGPIDTPRQFHQLGIFVLDGSGSMAGQARGGVTKAEAVNEALRGLLTRFKVSKNKNDFSFAVVTFDHNGKLKYPTTSAVDIDDNDNYDPMIGHGGGTDIMQGLTIAQKLAEDHMAQYQAGGPPHSVIILVMTDGEDGNKSGTIQKSDEIKNGAYGGQTTICTTYFGSIGNSDTSAKDHLKAIATDRVMGFKEVYDAETLRGFFIKSISSASGVRVD